LAKRGYDLILVARNQSRLTALAQRLKNETGRSVETIAADLNDKSDLARIEATLRTNPSITLLVNNAGVGAAAPLLNSDVDKMDEMIRLNVGTLTRLIYAAAPGFVARGGGTIVNIASMAAISPETLNRLYGGGKAFVLALHQRRSITSHTVASVQCRYCRNTKFESKFRGNCAGKPRCV